MSNDPDIRDLLIALTTQVSDIRATMATKDDLTRTRGEIMARIDRLSNEVTGFRNDLALSYAASAEASQAAQAASMAEGYLRQRVDLLQSQVMSLKGTLDDSLREHEAVGSPSPRRRAYGLAERQEPTDLVDGPSRRPRA